MALAAAMLMVAAAAPASAVPGENNEHISPWTISCPGMYDINVVAKGVPGRDIASEKGTPPIHLVAAVWNVWENGAVIEGPFVMEAPRGLQPKPVPRWAGLFSMSERVRDERMTSTATLSVCHGSTAKMEPNGLLPLSDWCGRR